MCCFFHVLGSYNAVQRLDEVIEQAERESKILANEINQWLVQESGSLLKEDEQMHFRSRRSVDEADEDVRTDANLFSEVSRLIVRRDVGKDKETQKKPKGSTVIKTKDEKVEKESFHLLKKHGLDIPADKHNVKKATPKKKAEDQEKDRKVSDISKTKRVSKPQGTKTKQKTNNDELSKENLVKALIGGDEYAKGHKEQNGVPEKAYRELVEYFAGSEQPTIETGSKKSEIAQPSLPEEATHKGDQRGTASSKHVVRRKLTKKHKRVLEILSKMNKNVLRKYFHLKGLDKYWKLMESIKKNHTGKENVVKKLKAYKDKKTTKKMKDFPPTKLEKTGLLHKQAKPHHSKQALPQNKIVKDKAPKKIGKHETAKTIVKDKAIKKVAKNKTARKAVKDKTKVNSQKPLIVQSSSSPHGHKLVGTETHQKLSTTKDKASHFEKKQSHKIAVEKHTKDVVKFQKDKAKNPPNETANKDAVKVEEKNNKNDADKSGAHASKISLHANDAAALNKPPEKPKSPQVKVALKQKDEKKVDAKPAALKQTVLPKNTNAKAIHGKDLPTKTDEVMKVNVGKVKNPGVPSTLKSAEKLKGSEKKDESTHHIEMAKPKPQEHKETLQEQLKAMAPKVLKLGKVIRTNGSVATHEKPKQIPKNVAVKEHHGVKTMHAPQQAELRNDQSSPVKQEHSGSTKIHILKEKIRKTNNLKFKVAQALLAHCETQNRLRQVFDDVNSSLKKAATLAKAIGAKFGIKPHDIERMTSEHTEGAVEQFLNQLF